MLLRSRWPLPSRRAPQPCIVPWHPWVGIGPGDEVLVPALAVIMSIVPVLYLGATPVFVDSAPGQIDFDYADLVRKITPRTRAILPVYLWGTACMMPQLMEIAAQHGFPVVEDACQAHGSTWDGKAPGTWGKAGCFSMRDGTLIATGEGGFLLTNDRQVAAFCRAFRTHWSAPGDPISASDTTIVWPSP